MGMAGWPHLVVGVVDPNGVKARRRIDGSTYIFEEL
jgi:hypothetical protein